MFYIILHYSAIHNRYLSSIYQLNKKILCFHEEKKNWHKKWITFQYFLRFDSHSRGEEGYIYSNLLRSCYAFL